MKTLVVVLLLLGPRISAQEPILLWPNGAPGSEGKTGDERVRLTDQGDHIVSSVHRPSIAPYLPPAAQANGAAVIVIPGGGHRELWMDHEGYRVGHWLAEHGIAAFVLKYRLAREDGSTYTVEGTELADVRRAIRLVRRRASEWHIDPDRVGVIGFSAGGELAALAGLRVDVGPSGTADAVDRESSRPAFLGLVYPAIPENLTLSKDTPPVFLLCGENDSPAISEGVPELYRAIRRAGGSAEIHILAGVGHGFGIRENNPPAVALWPSLFYDWLDSRGLLLGRTAGQARPSAGELTPQMRDGIPSARPVAAYWPADRVDVARKVLKLANPLTLGPSISLTPNAPSAGNGAHLSVWKPSFVLGTPSGGEAGFNFWGIHNEGHVNVGFAAEAGSSYLLDCRLLSAGRITYKIYDGATESFRGQAEVPLADEHLLLLVAAPRQGGAMSVELWPTPVTEPMGFLGCDLSLVSGPAPT